MEALKTARQFDGGLMSQVCGQDGESSSAPGASTVLVWPRVSVSVATVFYCDIWRRVVALRFRLQGGKSAQMLSWPLLLFYPQF